MASRYKSWHIDLPISNFQKYESRIPLQNCLTTLDAISRRLIQGFYDNNPIERAAGFVYPVIRLH